MVKLSRAMAGKASLTMVIAIVIIAIVYLVVGVPGFFQTVENQNNEEVCGNMTSQQLPEEVINKLESIRERNSFSVTRWEVDEQRKSIILYEVYMNEDQINELQREKIDGWTITVLKDVEYIKKREKAWAELIELEKDTKLQIAGFDMGADEVNMWVYNLTPENQALDGQKIHGWTIRIWKALTPTPTVPKG